MSCELAQEQGPYETYEGSPMSKGKLQPDMWGCVKTPPPKCGFFFGPVLCFLLSGGLSFRASAFAQEL